ncbi:hypothetical protein Q8G32_28580 [Priestia megaterium]|uniref:hypothetical protein n=1 Tax=Priestia megaterium TaxID=1404 RepID=UPI00272F627D|nr:hypothetical protein [Priestia megaterium]MDP1471799.1 hypothetical protein [Priestia megaterium]
MRGDEVLRDLKEDSIYTSREIKNFIHDNRNALILCDNSQITDDSKIQYKVIRRIENYIHKQVDGRYGVYHIPSSVSVIYEIERV